MTPEARDRAAKLLLMLSSSDGEQHNAARAIAKEVDLHALAGLVRDGEAPGAGDAFFRACRPFLAAALEEVRSSSWALSGDEPKQLRAIVAALELGKLDAAQATALWVLVSVIRRRVRR